MNHRSYFSTALLLIIAPVLHAAEPAKLPFTISKETTVLTSPLQADGTPDYAASLNEKYGKGVVAENNGFVDVLNIVGAAKAGYRPEDRVKVLALAHAKPQEVFAVFLRYEEFLYSKELTEAQRNAAWDETAATARSVWSQKDHADLAAYLAAYAQHLDALVKASAKPRWWAPTFVREGRSLAEPLPSWSFVDALRWRATLKAGSGDLDGALADLLAIKRLARQMASGSSLTERGTAIIFNYHADETIGALVGSGKATPAQFAALAVELKRLAPMGSVEEAINVGYRWHTLDLMISIATRRASTVQTLQGNPATTFDAVAGEKIDWNKALRFTNAWLDQQVASVKPASLKEVRSLGDALEKQHEKWEVPLLKLEQELARRPDESRDAHTQRATELLLGFCAYTATATEELSRRGRMEDAMLDLLLLAATAKVRTGQWPATLPALAPDAKLTQDLYPLDAPGPLKYAVTPGGVRIYSVGKNGRDDGGVSDPAKDLDDIVVGAR